MAVNRYLDLAEALLRSSNPYDKSAEYKFRSYLRLAELTDSSKTSQRSRHIQYVNDDERDAWVQYLRTGYSKRDMTSAGGGLGSTSGLVPLGFYNKVTESLKMVDEVLDAEVSTVLRTERGSPYAVPLDNDVNSAAVVVAENEPSTTQDPVMGGLLLPQAPTFRTSLFLSMEFWQDSGIDLPEFLARAFGIRFARGFGPVAVNAVLSAASGTVAASGAAASGQAGPSTAVGSDDLVKLAQSLDAAYFRRSCWCMQPQTHLAIQGLRGSGSGQLVFPDARDADGHPLLLGRRVLYSPSMPVLGGGGKSVILGDFSRLILRLGSSMTVQVSTERRPETASLYYWGTLRAQAGVAQDSSTTDRPFVCFTAALAAAAEGERSQPATTHQGGSHHEAEKHGHHRTSRTQ
jgi:HK97 family phage major capsid protein